MGWDGCATDAHTAVIPQDRGMPLGEGFMVNAWVPLDGNGFWCIQSAQLLDFFFFLPSTAAASVSLVDPAISFFCLGIGTSAGLNQACIFGSCGLCLMSR